MTTSRSPKPTTRPGLPLIAATTAALPAVMLSSLAVAQPAVAEPRPRAIPASLAAAMKAQATALQPSALIPAAAVPAAIPSALRPAKVGAPAVYTINRGDTISAIAKRFGLNTQSVLALNKLRSNSVIYPGQKIKLTGSVRPAAAPAAPARTAVAARTTVAAPARVYAVRSGDTLSGIAARHGVKLSSLLSSNGLNLRSVIYPGQKIKLGAGAAAPVRVAAPAAPAKVRTVAPAPARSGPYTIKSGDTLSGIAARHGVKLSAVLSANRLTMSSVIYPGQKLAIPGGTVLKPAATPPKSTAAPLVPSTFLGFSYPAAVVSSANQNKALLNASPVPSRQQMKQIVADTARRMGVAPSLAMAFAFQESSFDHRSVSPANAIGTMQVIPSSGQWASELVGRKLNLLDPYDNATAGVAIIRQLVRTSKNLDHAIAGYYQGQYSVSKYGMYDDTKAYVASIKKLTQTFS